MNQTASTATQNNQKQFDDNMRGVLYKNKQKTEAKHPGARGRAMVNGIWYWLSSWTQHSKMSGEKYQSLAFTPMTDEEIAQYVNNREQSQSKPQTQTQAQSGSSQNSDEQAQQQYQEYNPDGSVRQPNNVQDFDSDIPF